MPIKPKSPFSVYVEKPRRANANGSGMYTLVLLTNFIN